MSSAMMQLLLPMMGAVSNVRATLLEQERTMLVGPRTKKNPEGKHERGRTTKSSLTLGGRIIPFTRLRVHTKDELTY